MINYIQEDITALDGDCIVNAANEQLLPGSGVCGAIHTAAGPELAEECLRVGYCGVGEARITGAYNITNVRHIIHTVGPVWRGGRQGEEQYLANCYEKTLLLASHHHIRTIAFPNISTGIFGFPKNTAARIAVDTVKNFQPSGSKLDRVTFCCFDDENTAIYKTLLG